MEFFSAIVAPALLSSTLLIHGIVEFRGKYGAPEVVLFFFFWMTIAYINASIIHPIVLIFALASEITVSILVCFSDGFNYWVNKIK